MVDTRRLGVLVGVAMAVFGLTFRFLCFEDTEALDALIETAAGPDADASVLAGTRSPIVESVAVAGAWRLPRHQGMSRAFRVRLMHGLRMALLMNAKRLILTGGRNDSVIAREWILENVDPSWVLGSEADGSVADKDGGEAMAKNWGTVEFLESAHPILEQRIAGIRSRLLLHATMKSYLSRHPELEIVIENASTTTYENAVETAKLLDAHSPSTVLVVSSSYHMQRCRLLFAAALPTHRILVSAPVTGEFEMLVPPSDKWVMQPDVPTRADAVPAPQRSESPDARPYDPHRPHMFPVADFIPDSAKTFAFVVKHTYAHWRECSTATLKSIWVGSAVREAGAFIKNIYNGQLPMRLVLQGLMNTVVGAVLP